MSFFSKKGPYDIDHDGLSHPTKKKKPISRETKTLAIWLLINTILAVALYFGVISVGFNAILWIYLAVAVVLLLIYVIYNQGFVLRGVTPEMLSDTLSPEEKQQMIHEAKRRLTGSRWMLTILIPLTVAVMADAVYMFLLEDVIRALETLMNQ